MSVGESEENRLKYVLKEKDSKITALLEKLVDQEQMESELE